MYFTQKDSLLKRPQIIRRTVGLILLIIWLFYFHYTERQPAQAATDRPQNGKVDIAHKLTTVFLCTLH